MNCLCVITGVGDGVGDGDSETDGDGVRTAAGWEEVQPTIARVATSATTVFMI